MNINTKETPFSLEGTDVSRVVLSIKEYYQKIRGVDEEEPSPFTMFVQQEVSITPKGNLGLEFRQPAYPFIVKAIHKGLAQELDFQVGDEFTEVNGEDVALLSWDVLASKLSNRPVTLRLVRQVLWAPLNIQDLPYGDEVVRVRNYLDHLLYDKDAELNELADQTQALATDNQNLGTRLNSVTKLLNDLEEDREEERHDFEQSLGKAEAECQKYRLLYESQAKLVEERNEACQEEERARFASLSAEKDQEIRDLNQELSQAKLDLALALKEKEESQCLLKDSIQKIRDNAEIQLNSLDKQVVIDFIKNLASAQRGLTNEEIKIKAVELLGLSDEDRQAIGVQASRTRFYLGDQTPPKASLADEFVSFLEI